MSTVRDEAWLLRDKYNGVRTALYDIDVERLRRGEPLAYVVGWVPFMHTRISLDSYPLIPRPETEFWTAKAIERMTHGAPDLRALDLCAGSGAIGVAVAYALPHARVDFVEVDPAHRTTITENICDNGIDFQNTRVLIGDLFTAIPAGTLYDFVLTNPPYIDPTLDRTEPSVKNFEPHLALYGGPAGIKIIERILRDARHYLAAPGELWLEHEPEQTERINSLARVLGYRTCETTRDQFGVLRFSILRQ